MRFPRQLAAKDFLSEYWQKRALPMPAAFDPKMLPEITPDELGWLAMRDDVESRLVFSHDGQYELQHGPFSEQQLLGLTDENWTLLVNDVEKHLPAFRRWLSLVPFLADWRIDDIMISAAAPGGSVGPHCDNYDVFLCQLSGDRRWLVTTDALRQRDADDGLKLLDEFEDPSPFIASPGDVYYLPPGVAHWGRAEKLCVTLSNGMRAPTVGEFSDIYAHSFPRRKNPFCGKDHTTFFNDPDVTEDEAQLGKISDAAVRRCIAMSADSRLTEQEAATLLGTAVTGLKEWLRPEPLSEHEVADARMAIADGNVLDVHGMTRLAWWYDKDNFLAFINGSVHVLTMQDGQAFKLLCQLRVSRFPSGTDGFSTVGLELMLRNAVFDPIPNSA